MTLYHLCHGPFVNVRTKYRSSVQLLCGKETLLSCYCCFTLIFQSSTDTKIICVFFLPCENLLFVFVIHLLHHWVKILFPWFQSWSWKSYYLITVIECKGLRKHKVTLKWDWESGWCTPILSIIGVNIYLLELKVYVLYWKGSSISIIWKHVLGTRD